MNAWTKKLHNNLHLLLLAAVLIATGALVVACGGGGGGGGGGGSPQIAAQNFGEITAKGSVWVNGVEFKTTGATVVMDGTQLAVGDDSKLRVGMVVGVEGTMNDDGVGTATKVTFEDTLQGPVASKNTASTPDGTGGTATTLSVLGKTVLVTADTKIDDSAGGTKTLDNVLLTEMVEVSGGVDDLGRIVATHIELKGINEISEVTGKVEALSPLRVSGVTITGGTLPTGTVVGSLVEVKGSFDGTTLTAATIELKTGLQNDDNLHFEGFVTSGDSGSFVLQGHHLNQTLTVTTTGNTLFMGGVKGDLVAGTKVEVEGALTGTTIAATKVKFKENVRIEMAAGAQVSTREGIELHFLSGVTVITDATTRMTGGLTNIIDGADLKIRGRLNRDGNKVIATRVDINNPLGLNKINDVILRGPVTAPIGSGNSSLTIAGVTISTTGVTFRPNDDNGTDTLTVPSADFFAKVKVGTVVKAKGAMTADNVFIATEIELED
jgi:hypothetical protein